jgi:protein SCO1/2
MSKSKNSIPALIVVAVLAVAFGVYFQSSTGVKDTLPTFEKAIILPNSKAIQGVEFVDHQGHRFSKQQLLGRWNILFFGFTNCPDICPTTMQTLKQVKNKLVLDNVWGNYQVIMVSVDPDRDTTQQLSNYVPYFDPEFIGINGSLDATTEFSKQLGILFYANEADDDGRYDVDHGTALILVNPMGEMAGVISAPHQADVIARDLSKLAQYYAQDHEKPVAKLLSTQVSTPQQDQSTVDKAIDLNSDLSLTNGWIRPAPEGVANLAGYFDLLNTSDTDITITQVESPSFDNAMIHQTVVSDGTASMQHLDGLLVPARGRVSLAPLATHLMLMEPERDLQIGESITVRLSTFAGQTYQFELEVRQNPSVSN